MGVGVLRAVVLTHMNCELLEYQTLAGFADNASLLMAVLCLPLLFLLQCYVKVWTWLCPSTASLHPHICWFESSCVTSAG